MQFFKKKKMRLYLAREGNHDFPLDALNAE